MRRYVFLEKESIFEALNQLRHAFLAAKDGEEVTHIIKAVLTFDEQMKIGRRIQIAQLFLAGFTFKEVVDALHVGRTTVLEVERKLEDYKEAFDLIRKREEKVESEYSRKAFVNGGGSKLLYKKKAYTGYSRKKVKR